MSKAVKKISCALLGVIAVLCLVMVMVPMLKKPTQAKAASVTTLEMVEGASVRLDEYSGIRFTANVSEEFFNSQPAGARWGFMVSKSSGLTADNFQAWNDPAIKEVRIRQWVSDTWSEDKKAENPGIKQYTIVLTGLSVEEYQKDLSARAFVVNGSTYTYSDNWTTRKIAKIANEAQIDATKSYTTAEKDKLSTYVNACVTGSNHTYANAGNDVFVSGVGYQKTCDTCGAVWVSDPVKAWNDGEGIPLDRNGIELLQTKAPNVKIGTFEATLKITDISGANKSEGAVIFSNAGDNDERNKEAVTFQIGINRYGNFRVCVQGLGIWGRDFSTSAVNSNWYHMAMTFDYTNGDIKLYINGVWKETQNVPDMTGQAASHRPFFFGRSYHSGNPGNFNGGASIKNAALWSTVRNESTIASDMNNIYYLSSELISAYDFTDGNSTGFIKDCSRTQNTLLAHDTWFAFDDEEKADLGEYAYSMAVVGDTQSLVNFYPDKMDDTYQWIVDKKDEFKIEYVLNMGDMTENKYSTHGSVAHEWQPNRKAIALLDGVIPYQLVRGNHDATPYYNNAFNNDTYNVNVDGTFRNDMYDHLNNGRYKGGLENSYSFQIIGGYKYLFINLNNVGIGDGWLLNQAEMNWANALVEANQDCRVIVSTHSFLDVLDGAYNTSGDGNGLQMWEEFISQHKNVMMVLCGHQCWDSILMRRDNQTANGNTVTSLLINPQYHDQNNGARGMVAMLYFSKDGKQIKTRYFSAVNDQLFSKTSYLTIDISEYENIGKTTEIGGTEVDTQAPTITPNNPETGLVGKAYSLKSALVRDDKDGFGIIPTYQVFLKSDTARANPIELNNYTFTPTTDETHVVVVTATDAAGNVGSIEYELIIRKTPLATGVLENFENRSTINTYTGNAPVQWYNNYNGAKGVLKISAESINATAGHGFDAIMSINNLPARAHTFKLVEYYDEVSMSKNLGVRMYADSEIIIWKGYADSDGYGTTNSMAGTNVYGSATTYTGYTVIPAGTWTNVPIEYFTGPEVLSNGTSVTDSTIDYSDVSWFTDLAKSSSGVRLFSALSSSDIYIDGIYYLSTYDGNEGINPGQTGDEALIGQINFDSAADALKLISFDSAGREYLAEYDGAQGVVKATNWHLSSDGTKYDYWYGVQIDLNATASQLATLTWDYLEIKFTMGWTEAAPNWNTTTIDSASDWTFTDEGNWKVGRITKDKLIAKYGSLDNFYTYVTDGKLDWNPLFYVSYLANTTGIYFDYMRLVADPASQLVVGEMDFSSSSQVSYVKAQENVSWVESYEGATGVAKGTAKTGNWYGIQVELPGTATELSQLNWNTLQIKFTFGFDHATSGRTTWDGFAANGDGWTYVTDGVWRIYSISKTDLTTRYGGSLDTFYSSLTNGSDSANGLENERFFHLWNLSDHGTIYIDYAKLTYVNHLTIGEMDFNYEEEISYAKAQENVSWLASYEGATGVSKGTTKTGDWYGIQVELPGTAAQLSQLNWNVLQIKFTFGFDHATSGRTTWDGFAANGDGWTYVTDGVWRIYSISKADLTTRYCGSLDTFYSSLTNGSDNANGLANERFFHLWNLSDHGTIYIDYAKLTYVEEAKPGEMNFDSESDLAYGISLEGKEFIAEYQGATGVMKSTGWKGGESWYGIQIDFNATADELRALTWEKLEIKIHTSGRPDYLTNWTLTEGENGWKIYSISKDNIIAQVAAESSSHTQDFYVSVTDGILDWSQFFYVWDVSADVPLYIDYVRLV